MDGARLRAEFPALARTAYLNAGTFGPVPAAAARAAAETWSFAAGEGRGGAYIALLGDLHSRLRGAYADVLGADAAGVALTTSTSEGLVRVLTGLDLGPGDEIVTAHDEHPGLLGPLAALRDQHGVRIRAVALAEVPEAVGHDTRLVACSHVAWSSGALAPAALAQLDVPVLYDGAQAVGAVPIDLAALGASFYTGPGQKWLCGPEGLGMLWVSPSWRDRVAMRGPTYENLAEPGLGLQSPLHPDARRFDASALAGPQMAAALASYDVLAEHGWDAVHTSGIARAATLAEYLRERGHVVADRGPTTLVAWTVPGDDVALAERQRLAAAGVIVRDLPGFARLRASVGAWNDEADLARLLDLLA